MKCPKCGYLGFERVERCRNCGYDFSFTEPEQAPEFRLRDGPAEVSPLDDLSLVDAAALRRGEAASGGEPPLRTAQAARGSGVTPADLPLFGETAAEDGPLITRASAPRPPLAVRRATPEVPRLRDETARLPATPMLDLEGLDLPSEFEDMPRAPVFTPAERALASDRWPSSAAGRQPAALLARGVAALIDLSLLSVIDLLVVYFTMKICGLNPAELDVLPKVPLVAFLVVQNGGYLVTFTAGGQTLGKMAAGIRVVPAREGASLDLPRALLRTVVWVALAVPAGLGFLPTLFSSDRRGLHDRCAGTRVVRVSA